MAGTFLENENIPYNEPTDFPTPGGLGDGDVGLGYDATGTNFKPFSGAALNGTVADLATLQTLDRSSFVSDRVYVKGFATPDDGGQGWFRWIDSDTVTNDALVANGVTLFDSLEGSMWKRITRVLTPEMGGCFGYDDWIEAEADANNEDCTSVIQTMCDLYVSDNYDVVSDPDKFYRCEGPLLTKVAGHGFQFRGWIYAPAGTTFKQMEFQKTSLTRGRIFTGNYWRGFDSSPGWLDNDYPPKFDEFSTGKVDARTSAERLYDETDVGVELNGLNIADVDLGATVGQALGVQLTGRSAFLQDVDVTLMQTRSNWVGLAVMAYDGSGDHHVSEVNIKLGTKLSAMNRSNLKSQAMVGWVVAHDPRGSDGRGGSSITIHGGFLESGATAWVAGTNYSVDDIRQSQVDRVLYRCTVAGLSSGDATDLANGSDTGCTWVVDESEVIQGVITHGVDIIANGQRVDIETDHKHIRVFRHANDIENARRISIGRGNAGAFFGGINPLHITTNGTGAKRTAHFAFDNVAERLTYTGENEIGITGFQFYHSGFDDIFDFVNADLMYPDFSNQLNPVLRFGSFPARLLVRGYTGYKDWGSQAQKDQRRCQGYFRINATGKGVRWGVKCFDSSGFVVTRQTAAAHSGYPSTLGDPGLAVISGTGSSFNNNNIDEWYSSQEPGDDISREFTLHDMVREFYFVIYADTLEAFNLEAINLPGASFQTTGRKDQRIVKELPQGGAWLEGQPVTVSDGVSATIEEYVNITPGRSWATKGEWTPGIGIKRGTTVHTQETGAKAIWQVADATPPSNAGTDTPTPSGTNPYTDNAGVTWRLLDIASSDQLAFFDPK